MIDEKRTHFRFKPGRVSYVKVEDYYFPLIDISEGGFSAKITNDTVEQDSIIDIEVSISDPSGSILFNTTTEILRVNNSIIAGKWDLDLEHSFTINEYFKNHYRKVA